MRLSIFQRKSLFVSFLFFLAGSAVYLVTIWTHFLFDGVYRSYETYKITYGDIYFQAGTSLGQVFWFFCISYFADVLSRSIGYFRIMQVVCWWWINYGFFDIIDSVFLNPYEVSLPKYAGALVSAILTILILIKNRKWITQNTPKLRKV